MMRKTLALILALVIVSVSGACASQATTSGVPPTTTPAVTVTSTMTVTSTTIVTSPVTVTPTPTIPADTQVASARQKTVNALKALTAGQTGPTTNATIRDSPRLKGWFDPDLYFSVLNHISMEPGYVLDYVYHNDGSGGHPYLYARQVDSKPFNTLDELNKSYTNQQVNHTYDYLDHVRTDGTEEGFFQYVVLRILGGQFYLWWHANYNDRVIVCDHAKLEELFASPSFSPGLKPPVEVLEAARQLDLAPKVESGNDSAAVRVITFTKWGGFAEETYTISRAFPHAVRTFESKILVPWTINLTF